MAITMVTTVLTNVTEQMQSPQDDCFKANSSAIPPSCVRQLKNCLRLAKDAHSHELANRMYQALRDRLMIEQPDSVELLDLMWHALLASHRSASLWEKLCQTEQQLTDQMADSHVQLQQSYYRLVQEM